LENQKRDLLTQYYSAAFPPNVTLNLAEPTVNFAGSGIDLSQYPEVAAAIALVNPNGMTDITDVNLGKPPAAIKPEDIILGYSNAIKPVISNAVRNRQAINLEIISPDTRGSDTRPGYLHSFLGWDSRRIPVYTDLAVTDLLDIINSLNAGDGSLSGYGLPHRIVFMGYNFLVDPLTNQVAPNVEQDIISKAKGMVVNIMVQTGQKVGSKGELQGITFTEYTKDGAKNELTFNSRKDYEKYVGATDLTTSRVQNAMSQRVG
jgi:hypothetical protein